jgi:hypothetical protein
VQTVGAVQRHQVTELPPIQARIIEYQCHRVICPECGESTRAAVPELAASHFGPQLAALIAYLTVVCRMPRRVVEALLEQVLGVEISLGRTQKCWEEASRAVAAPCQELQQQLKDEPVLNVDETGWRTNGDKRFLWALVAARYVVYTVAATRGSKVLIGLLGAVFQGILCSDRFSAYLKYHSGKAQFCWAHLKRNLLGIAEFTKSSAVERFGRDAVEAFRNQIEGPSPFLFPNADNTTGYQASFKKVWATTLRKAGVPYFRIHDLRSTYATRLSAGGVADEWVTQCCGRATPRCSRSTRR